VFHPDFVRIQGHARREALLAEADRDRLAALARSARGSPGLSRRLRTRAAATLYSAALRLDPLLAAHEQADAPPRTLPSEG
jgi:hypothetical protein